MKVLKIIGYILIFAGCINVIGGISTGKSEKIVFGIFIGVLGGVIIRYSRPKKQ